MISDKDCLTVTRNSCFCTIALLLSCVCVDNVSLLSQNYSTSNCFFCKWVRKIAALLWYESLDVLLFGIFGFGYAVHSMLSCWCVLWSNNAVKVNVSVMFTVTSVSTNLAEVLQTSSKVQLSAKTQYFIHRGSVY